MGAGSLTIEGWAEGTEILFPDKLELPEDS